MKASFSTLALFILALCASEGLAGVVVCQYASWAVYRPEGGTFSPDMVDPFLCTHAVYVTAGLDQNDQLVSLDPWADLETGGGKGGYKKFTGLKTQNPEFKPILALGAWANANYQYSSIAADPARRAVLAQSAVSFLKQHGFVGLEVDWLYPLTVNDKANFPLLLAAIREAFEPEGFELMATMAAVNSTVQQAYDLPAIVPSLHYFLLIAYDYEGAWNPWTGHSAPLFLDNSTLCVDSTVQLYLDGGVPSNQIVMGLPGFGRTYTLADPAQHGLGDASIGYGDAGPYTQAPGILSHNEIVLNFDGWTVERDPLNQAAYGYKGNQWLSMDDATSTQFKGEYCVAKGLAGMAIWTVDEDYFGGGAFPLLNAINLGLGNK